MLGLDQFTGGTLSGRKWPPTPGTFSTGHAWYILGGRRGWLWGTSGKQPFTPPAFQELDVNELFGNAYPKSTVQQTLLYVND